MNDSSFFFLAALEPHESALEMANEEIMFRIDDPFFFLLFFCLFVCLFVVASGENRLDEIKRTER